MKVAKLRRITSHLPDNAEVLLQDSITSAYYSFDTLVNVDRDWEGLAGVGYFLPADDSEVWKFSLKYYPCPNCDAPIGEDNPLKYPIDQHICCEECKND